MAATPCLVTLRKWCGWAALADGLDRPLGAPVGAVLEPHRHAEAGGQLAVHLALGGARADRAPGDEVGQELRADGVEELGARGQAERGHVGQEAPGAAQPLVDGEAAVEAGIVDEPLPAHGGARLLEVDAHHDEEVLAAARPPSPGASRVLEARPRGSWIEQGPTTTSRRSSWPWRIRPTASRDRATRARGLGRGRHLLHEDRRRQEGPQALDAEVVGPVLHEEPMVARARGGSSHPSRRAPPSPSHR